MKKSTKVVYLEKSQPAHAAVVKAGQYSGVVGACRGILFQMLNEAVKELFVQVDDDLYRLAENSTSNSRQTLFFDAMRTIRLLQKQAEPAYLQMIEDAYQAFWNGEAILSEQKEEAGDESSFSLVEKDELEEELAVTTMINKANDACHRELVALNIRFAHMTGKADLASEGNPVSPAMLAMAFRETLQEWDSEVLARIVVYKCFDRVVLSRLKACYEAMNRYLAENGVMPELRHGAAVPRPGGGVEAPASQAVPGEAAPSQEPVAGEPPAAEQVPSLSEIWQYIQQLSANSAFAAPATLTVNPSLPVMPRANVMQALSRIQYEVLTDEELHDMDLAVQQEFIRQQLAQALEQQNQKGEATQRVGETEQQTIDVILMLFNHVLDDPNLPDAMRALIGRLQIPVLKAAIADPTFLHNEAHPARRLIDDLAQASMGWRDDGDRSEKSLYTQVKKAVERIVHDYEEDISLFEEVRAEFAAYMERRERTRQILEERLAQAVSGEERLTVAKLKVEELLKEFGSERLPEAAREILEGPWKKLLTILWLREGEEGSNWKKAVEIATLMGKYLGGEPQKPTRERLLAEIPEILGGLKKGFAYISLDQKKSAALLHGLQSCFIAALRPTTAKPAAVQPEAVQADRDEEEVAEQTEPEHVPDEFDEKVQGIAEGTWVRLLLEEDGEVPVVCKLVWRSKYTGTMVFVDGQGNKAAQIKEEQLADYFRNGRAALLEDAQAPLIDRAIRKMMRVLNAEIVGLRLKMAD
ncbi:MAG: hypothetical protein DSZ00_02485 [Gammaproteobacteria bacterium]|nr:MAG: hypothetical protein DSZ00_02485 [Gammaproteobacteria bacterium]RTZ76671.1 MAG: hypothetical protein DSZ02_00615 [Gammaproteobacteria bacterium]RTZ80398.1 MAG: hypothetical protein DSZ01_02270 [Gammaproteobacteria bacterium]